MMTRDEIINEAVRCLFEDKDMHQGVWCAIEYNGSLSTTASLEIYYKESLK